MKNFFSKVGRFFKKYYWIEPLLLVVIVFAVVFSLEGASNVWDSIKSWFSPNYICKQCDRVNIDEANKAIDAIKTKEGQKVYVYYYEKATTDNGLEDCNEILNSYIKGYNKGKSKDEKLVVYAVKYSVKETGDVTGEITKWHDRKMTEEKYDRVADDINAWLETKSKEVTGVDSTSSYTAYNQVVVEMPTLVCYVGTSDGYKVEYAIRGTNEFDVEVDKLGLFFQGKYTDFAK